MQISSNFKDVIKGLSDLDKKQIPFAISKALNDTAFQAKDALVAQMRKKLDNPTPFTLRAVKIKKATKDRQYAFIYIDDTQAKYLDNMYFGGVKTPKKKAIVVPTKDVRLNKYGNLTRNKVKNLLKSPNYFSGVVKGKGGTRSGIFRKYKNGTVKQVIIWEASKKEKKRLDFKKSIAGVVEHRFDDNFRKALEFAIKTAR